MNSIATRRAPLAEVHGDVIDLPKMTEDERHIFVHGRASDKIHFEPFNLPRRPLLPNWNAVGTPGEIDRARQARIDRAWVKVFRCAVAIILAFVALAVYHAFLEPHAPKTVSGDDVYYRQRAERLATGRSIYVTDPHENCLVGMHRTATGHVGLVLVSNHC